MATGGDVSVPSETLFILRTHFPSGLRVKGRAALFKVHLHALGAGSAVCESGQITDPGAKTQGQDH